MDTATFASNSDLRPAPYSPYCLVPHLPNQFWVGTDSAIVLVDTGLTFLHTRPRDMPVFDIQYLGNALYWRDSTGL